MYGELLVEVRKLREIESLDSSQCSVKNPEIHFDGKIFRKINSLATCFVNTLLSRNFCQKVLE